MKSIILTIAICGLLCSSCTKAEEVQVIAAISPVGACIADIVMAAEGVEDPAAIATTCSAAVSDVATVVSELLDNAPPTVVSDAAIVMADNVRAKLVRIQSRAVILMSDAGTQ